MWRRLRAAGAASLLNGAWALPSDDASAALFKELATAARTHGGHAVVLTGVAVDADATIIEQFRLDRARDYAEFDQRCDGFAAEVAKEEALDKFTYAELEEIEDDFAKLAMWLGKIEARDFFPNGQRQGARDTLARCATARDAFAATVYAREGLGAPA